MKIKLFIYTFLFSNLCLFSQEQATKSKYFGFNTNPILAQILPFNRIDPALTNASIMLRIYSRHNTGVRFAYGLSLGDDNDFLNMYLSIDNDKRRSISSKWLFFYGFGGGIKAVSNNFNRVPNSPVTSEFLIGPTCHWGIEYRVTNILSVSTEATLRIGLGFGNGQDFISPIAKIDPPINIIAHFNIFKQKVIPLKN